MKIFNHKLLWIFSQNSLPKILISQHGRQYEQHTFLNYSKRQKNFGLSLSPPGVSEAEHQMRWTE